MYQRWPSEHAFIARLLDQLVQDIEDLVRNRRNSPELSEPHELFHILEPVSRTSLLEDYGSCDNTEVTSQIIDFSTPPRGWSSNMYTQSRALRDGVTEIDGDRGLSLARTACENALDVFNVASTSTCHVNGTGSEADSTTLHNPDVQTVNPAEIYLESGGPDLQIVGHYQHLQPRPILTPRLRHPTIPQKRKACAAGSESTARTTAGSDACENRVRRTASRLGMYHSIASVESLRRLRSTILNTPGSAQSRSYASTTIAETMRVLDQLDGVQDHLALVRCVLLYRLSVHRDALVEAAQRRRYVDDSAAEYHDVRTVESETIDRMTQEIYPHTVVDSYAIGVRRWRKRFVNDRKKIANRLYHAQKWRRIVDRFGLGMLALVALGSELGAQNHRYAVAALRSSRDSCGQVRDTSRRSIGGHDGYVGAQKRRLREACCTQVDSVRVRHLRRQRSPNSPNCSSGERAFRRKCATGRIATTRRRLSTEYCECHP